MAPHRVAPAQKKLLSRLAERFGENCVREWAAFSGLGRHYSPRLDLAVGPFAVDDLHLRDRYDELALRHRKFLSQLWMHHRENVLRYGGVTVTALDTALRVNWNARCFLAIEIENKVSRKHLMGGAVNAAALGRLGIVVGWTEDKVRALVQVRQYLAFLGSVGKPTIIVENLLILTREQVLATF